jgi:metal transporter CNNM
MHPVPYYRIPKGVLADLKDHDIPDGEPLAKAVTGISMERKLSSVSDIGRSPVTKFSRRRNSGGIESFPVSNKPDDLRAHLKHLGPSNVASRPKSTRFNAVKIKPGQPAKSPLLTPQALKAIGNDAIRTLPLRYGTSSSDPTQDSSR